MLGSMDAIVVSGGKCLLNIGIDLDISGGRCLLDYRDPFGFSVIFWFEISCEKHG